MKNKVLSTTVLFFSLNVYAVFETAAFRECYRIYMQPAIDRVNQCNQDQLINNLRCELSFITDDSYGNQSYSTRLILYTRSQKLSNGAPADIVRLTGTYICGGSVDEVNLSNNKLRNNKQDRRKPDPKNPTCPGSVIDFSNGTVSENIPVAGTDFELYYNSSYNFDLPVNSSIESSYTFPEVATGTTNNFKLLSNGNEIYQQQFTTGTYNFKRKVNDSIALSYEDEFIKSYKYFLRMEQKEPASSTNPSPDFITIAMDTEENISKYKKEVWGLHGWNVSTHHYLDRRTNTVFFGTGLSLKYKDLRFVKIQPYGDVILAIDRSSGEEFYVFDYQGRHVETRDTKWNKPIRKFVYHADNKLDRIINRFGLETEFKYDSQNQLSAIKAPYGQLTDFLVENGSITKITNPLTYFNTMTYGASKELLSFKALDDEVTLFSYDADGRLLSEEKSSGVFQGMKIAFVGAYKTMQIQLRNFILNYSVEQLPTSDEDFANEISFIQRNYNSEGAVVTRTNSYLNELKQVTYYSDRNESIHSNYGTFWGRDYVGTVSTDRRIYGLGSDFLEKSKVEKNQNYSDLENFENNGGGSTGIFIGDRFMYFNYDKVHRVLSYSDSNGNASYTKVDDLGQPLEVTENGSPTKFFEYDSYHRMKTKIVGDFSENYSYDQYGYLSGITTASQTTIFINDAIGQVREQLSPNGDRTLFEYTAVGSISKITTSNGQVHRFNFSVGDYLSDLLTPDNKNTVYYYDQDKRVIKISKPGNKNVIYNYRDQTNRLESIELPNGIREQSQDEQGRILGIKSEDNIVTETSWVANQVKEQKWFDDDGSLIANLSFGFRNNILKINSVSLNGEEYVNYGAGDIEKGGDINGRINCAASAIDSVCFSQQDDISIRYLTQTSDDNSNISKSTYVSLNRNSGATGSFYRNISMVRKFFASGGASSRSEDSRNDSNGEHNAIVTIDPAYDELKRIKGTIKTSIAKRNGEVISSATIIGAFSYPELSNNNIKEYTQGQTRTVASHNESDQLIKLQGSINRNYEYNENGDLEAMTNCFGKTEYDYDVFGNLKKVVLPGNPVKTVEYKVDGYNRRVKKLVNGSVSEYYVWFDDLRIAAILDHNKQPKIKFIYALDSKVATLIVKDNTLYKVVHEPGLNSVRYIFNLQTKEVVQEIEYDEFGNQTKNTNPNFQPLTFAGGLYDSDTKLIRFGARDYDPTVGRWTTKDPIGFAGGNTNLYAYVDGDPMSKTDPSGKCPVCVLLIGAGVGAGANVAGAVATDSFNRSNAVETIAVGAAGGIAAVTLGGFVTAAGTMTAGQSLLALSVTSSEGIIGALGSQIVELGLNVLMNSPPPGATLQQIEAAKAKVKDPCPTPNK